MNSIEAVFYWAATLFLTASFLSINLFYLFKIKKAFNLAEHFLLTAFGCLTIFGVYRWMLWNHPPFVTLFESMISAIWFALGIYFLLSRLIKPLTALLIPVSISALLMMGWSSSFSKAASPLSQALDNTWLFIHASFATLGAAAFLIAASTAVLYLIGEDKLNDLRPGFVRMMPFPTLVRLMTNLVLAGFIFWGVMIVSGSIWAYTAWGRYWGWDPIELWSLISWLIYGLLFHARLAFRLKTRIFAWLTIFALFTVAFALWGVNYIYETIHSYG